MLDRLLVRGQIAFLLGNHEYERPAEVRHLLPVLAQLGEQAFAAVVVAREFDLDEVVAIVVGVADEQIDTIAGERCLLRDLVRQVREFVLELLVAF